MKNQKPPPNSHVSDLSWRGWCETRDAAALFSHQHLLECSLIVLVHNSMHKLIRRSGVAQADPDACGTRSSLLTW